MYLILFTIIYCVLTRVLDVDYGPALGIYIIGLGLAKGWRTKELRDVFNFRRNKYLYNKFGLKDSLTEYLSLFFVFLNALLIANSSFTAFELLWMLFLVGAVYRFIFWGVTQAIRTGN
ncbi:hypothetical protein VBD025_15810 [Virgibacillus flavescens]|uniref:hypothetical protein n=1 Tax=Virgibacillus flavescens TaxID=1611422 RepID=UPI003D32B858